MLKDRLFVDVWGDLRGMAWRVQVNISCLIKQISYVLSTLHPPRGFPPFRGESKKIYIDMIRFDALSDRLESEDINVGYKVNCKP